MAVKIKSYIEKIEQNKLVIPNFQREYVWSKDNVKRMIASLLFDLKIGAVLVYKDKEGVLPFMYFNDSTILSEKKENEIEYVIDGQQRLTSLMIAFKKYYESTDFTPKFKRNYFITLLSSTNLFGLGEKFEFEPLEIGGDFDYNNFVENNIDFVPSSRPYPNDEGRLPVIPIEYFCDTNKLIIQLNKVVLDKVTYIMNNTEGADSEFQAELMNRAGVWVAEFTVYAKSILEKELEMMTVEKSIDKAIKTYQIMNTTGQRLETLDILASYYSTEDSENRLYDVIKTRFHEAMNEEKIKKIDTNNLIVQTEGAFSDEYKIEWGFHKYMIDPAENEKAIPNKVLEQIVKLIKYVSVEKVEDKTDIEQYKNNELLKLKGKDIYDNLAQVLDSIEWAGAFLQIKCGLTSISKLNNYWMLFVLSVLRIKIDNFEEKHLDRLTAWYFLSRFTGRYRIDQNQKAMDDILGLANWIENDEKYGVLNTLLDGLAEDKREFNEYTKKEVLLCDSDLPPYDIVSQYICEYGAKDGYLSKILKLKESRDSEQFISVMTYPMTYQITESKLYKFQIDHIHPLGLATTPTQMKTDEIRKNKKHKYNSPLNKAYLTAIENNFISSRSYREFKDMLSTNYKTVNCMTLNDDHEEFFKERYRVFYDNLQTDMQRLINR